jgi:GNAT superfamily N-acetyltransferase
MARGLTPLFAGKRGAARGRSRTVFAVDVSIEELAAPAVAAAADELSQLLLDAHASGMALGLSAPLTRERAADEWRATAARLDPDDRVFLVARDDGRIVGTVQIVRAAADNGRHRAEIQRFAVTADMRGRGIGRVLLEAAVERAREMGLTLLWLSTHADTDSDCIYERLGWTRMGVMPGFAANPDGAIVGNVFYYLEL